jgi:iron(III) transport system substrate-binding protein
MDYLRKLAKQNIRMVNASARTILNQVVAGEYAIALQIFNHHAAISAAKGAPVDWLRLSPATVTPDLVALTKDSPHPNAGLLFVEFMISKEGQEIFRKAHYLPTRADVPPLVEDLIPQKGGFTATVLSPTLVDKEYDHWDTVAKQLFR